MTSRGVASKSRMRDAGLQYSIVHAAPWKAPASIYISSYWPPSLYYVSYVLATKSTVEAPFYHDTIN